MPSKAVDEAWHEMILMTREYTEFCERAFGRYLHHTPGLDAGGADARRCSRTRSRIVDDNELPMTLFTADTDAGLRGRLRVVARPTCGGCATRTPPGRAHRPHAPARATTSDGSASGWWGGGFFGGDGGGGSDGGGGGGGCGGGGCGGGG